MTNLSHVEQGALDRLVEWGGEKLLSQMVRLYLENSSERLEQIETGLASEDIEIVERAAHSLKSSAANVGAMKVSRIAGAMEGAAEQVDWDEIREHQTELPTALQAAREELEQVLNGLPEQGTPAS